MRGRHETSVLSVRVSGPRGPEKGQGEVVFDFLFDQTRVIQDAGDSSRRAAERRAGAEKEPPK